MIDIIIGSHVSFKKDTQLVGSVNEAISYGSTTFMFYTGAPQNTNRQAINNDLTKEAIDLMKKHKIKRLLVKKNNKLVGVLSLSDLLNTVDNNILIETYKTIFSINRNTDKYLTDIDEFEL